MTCDLHIDVSFETTKPNPNVIRVAFAASKQWRTTNSAECVKQPGLVLEFRHLLPRTIDREPRSLDTGVGGEGRPGLFPTLATVTVTHIPEATVDGNLERATKAFCRRSFHPTLLADPSAFYSSC